MPYSIPYNPPSHRLPAGHPVEESFVAHSSGGHHSRPSDIDHVRRHPGTAPAKNNAEGSTVPSSGGRNLKPSHSLGTTPSEKGAEGSVVHSAMAQHPSEAGELGRRC